MKTLFKSTFFFTFLLTGLNVSAQILVSSGQTAQQLAEFLAGPNITVTNAVITGSSNATGVFSGSNSVVGFDDGVILSTGNATSAAGPNTTTSEGHDLSTAGTVEMTTLIGAQSYDAITLEFDFEVQSSTIQFNYVFASEEYPEFAPPFGSGFNDAFAFYISGTGIVGQENIALVPNTSTIVSSNTINPQFNSQYFIGNPGGQDIEFDGFTTVLTASIDSLTPCTVYHLEIVIADGQDADYNSAVFLKENSLIQDLVNVETQTVNQDDIALEGCIKASFTFSYNDVSNEDRTLIYQIGGTAVNGVDYTYIDTIMTIPAGDTTGVVFIDAFSDGIAEGQESVFIIYKPDICSPNDTTFLYIDDAQPIEYELDGIDLDCFEDGSGEINITAVGGFPPYTYHLIDSTNVETETQSNPITGLDAGQYTVFVEDSYGCFAEALVIGGVFDADTTFLPDGSGVTYDAPLVISGFGAGQVITEVSEIQQVCLTMEHSFLGDLVITLESPSQEVIVLKSFGGGSCDLGEPFASGPVDGANSNLIDPGVGYEYCFNAAPIYGTMVAESNSYTHTIPSSTGGTYTDNYLPAGSYTSAENFSGLVGADMDGTWIVHVTDNFGLDNGYIFNWYISLIGDEPDSTVILEQPGEIIVTGFVQGTACGTSNGSINLNIESGESPYTYLWNNGEITKDISGLAAGSYTVTVTDANSCQTSETFVVNNSSSMSLTYTSVATSCFGGSDGTVDVNPAGGTSPYTYSWSNSAVTEDLSGLTSGDYTISVTDQLGCVFSEVITVNDAPEMIIGIANFSNEVCNTDNGAIDINVFGGSGSFSYSWSNGSSAQNISGLSSGMYDLIVTDANTCTGTISQILINDQSNCSAFCFLSVSSNSVVDEQCGDGNGSIDIETLNGNAPLNYSWNNGANTEDISGLTSGTYIVTVTDANNCSVTETYVINNNTGNLSIGGVVLNDENCGSSDGSIALTVNGGAVPYSYSWNSGEVIEDISNLSAGLYILTITDDVGCELTESYTVGNNSGTLSVVGVVGDEFCISANGSIDQTVTGGIGNLSYLWSGSEVTQDLSGLAVGSYTCTTTDQVGCYVTNTYNVNQNNGGMSIISNIVTNELCGNGQGAINITATGQNLSFSWSNGDNTEDISGLVSGDYICTISTPQGCTFVSSPISVLNSSGSMLVSTPIVIDEECTNGLGSIDVTVSNGATPYSYLWSSGQVTEDISNLSAGIYTVTVTDANGCSETHSVTVSNSPGTLLVQSVVTDETCGNGMGVINLTTSGGTIPYTYQWSNSEVTEDINGLSAGTYMVTISDGASCEITETYTLNNGALALSIASASISNELCNDGNGSISITIDGGNGPYNYSWNNGEITPGLSGLAAGTYQVTVTDANSCSVSESYVITNETGGLSVSSVVLPEFCGDATGAIDVTITNGNFPMTFVWDSGQSTPDITGLSAGIYTLTLTDNFGCQVIHSNTVVNNASGLAVSIVSVTNDSCGLGNGEIDALATGNGPFTFAWNSGQVTEDISGLSAGNYMLTVTDNAGCSVSVNESVTNQANTLAITFDNVGHENCANGQGFIDIEVSGTGPFVYAWSNGSATQDIIGLSAGVYSLIVTDDNGCQLTNSYVVNNTGSSNLATIDLVVTDAFCTSATGAINITATGGVTPYSYQWDSGQVVEDISGLLPGDYTLTVTDAVGCSYIDTWTIATQQSNLDITNIQIMNENCGDGSGAITVTSPTANSWYLDNVLSTGTPVNMFTDLSGDDYIVTVSDAYGCTLDSTVTVNNFSFFGVGHSQVDDLCDLSTGSIDLNVLTGQTPTFLWSNGAVTEDLSNLSADTYVVTVTVDFGPNFTCIETYSVTINNITPFSITDVITDENCGDGQGAIDQTLVTGSGITYSWSNGAITQDISGLSAGPYSCTVTESGGCVEIFDYVVVNIAGLMVSSGVVYEDTCFGGQGAIDLTVANGSGGYNYLWSNNSVSQDVNGLIAGSYTVTITDQADDCAINNSFQINNTDVQFAASGIITDEDCGTGQGAVDQTLVTGVGVTYLWSNGATTEDVTDLSAGNYNCIGKSYGGCADTVYYVVVNIPGPMISTGMVYSDTCSAGVGVVDLTVTSGSGNYDYSWSNSAITQDINGLMIGMYTVNIVDLADNCVLIDSFQVNNVEVLFGATGIITGASGLGNADGAIDVTVSGTDTYSYNWSNGENTQDVTGLIADVYTLDITSNQGCDTTLTFIIDNSLSVETNDLSNIRMKIVPNPANDKFTIKYEFPLEMIGYITIMDGLGRTVLHTDPISGSNELVIDAGNMSSGLYFVTFKSNQIIRTERLIITD